MVLQGYDLAGAITDQELGARQVQFTKTCLDKWLNAVPMRGGMQDVVPILFGRGLDIKILFKFLKYSLDVATNMKHFITGFTRDFAAVIGRGKPCRYNTTVTNIKATDNASKLANGYIYDLGMSRLLTQGLNQIRQESNPRIVIYCNIDTFDYGVIWFDQDVEIITAITTACLSKKISRMQWNWNARPIDAATAASATAACCRYGCKQDASVNSKTSKKPVKCEDCNIQQYCSKKCRKKDLKRHSKNCLQLDKAGNVALKTKSYTLDKHGNRTFEATEAPRECAECAKQEKSGDRLKACECKSVWYCNKTCMKTFWSKGHREKCQQMKLEHEEKEKKEKAKEKGKEKDSVVCVCQFEGCERTTKESGKKLMRCPCHTAWYCCKEHQKLAYPGHKKECKRLRKEISKRKSQTL